MKPFLNDLRIISKSGNIALYPSLASARGGLLGCAWYEYSSRIQPAPSDIWFSTSANFCNWTEPINISGGISYNNGPCLHWSSSGYYLIAWHSWRKPGKEPFLPGGDLCNIWVSKSEDGLSWSEPCIAFPDFPNTEYATITENSDGILSMAFYDRKSKRIHISRSKDGIIWEAPVPVPESLSSAKFPDLVIDRNDVLHLAYNAKNETTETIRLAISENGHEWKYDREVFKLPGVDLSKPKVNIDNRGHLWISCQSSEWGSHVTKYRVEIESEPLKIEIRADGTPGNALWILNAVDVSGVMGNYHKLFSFGPQIGNANDADTVQVTATGKYNPREGFGFEGKVDTIVRELGTRITRTLFCGDKPGTFIADLDRGIYDISVYFSSHIAAVPGTIIDIKGKVLDCRKPDVRNEKCFICFSEGVDWKYSPLCSRDSHDNNRPSKVIHPDGYPGGIIAWTRFVPNSTGIAVSPTSTILK